MRVFLSDSRDWWIDIPGWLLLLWGIPKTAEACYNVKIDGNVCGLGEVKHREFAFASGEMSASEFTGFLTSTLTHMAGACRDGAIAFVCMDWRHMREMLEAGASAFTEFKNLCVWNKTNGGMGSFYRSKHELVLVFKIGTMEHTNTFGLGDTGRCRTNVWDYAGISSIGGTRAEELAMHPTVKPVALVADAIRDCTKRGEIVLGCAQPEGRKPLVATVLAGLRPVIRMARVQGQQGLPVRDSQVGSRAILCWLRVVGGLLLALCETCPPRAGRPS